MAEKTEQVSFTEKANLIFEYDHRSPLFVRKAAKEIDQHNLEEAIAILENSLQYYPDHPVTYILLGSAFALQGEYAKALESYQTGAKLIDDPQTYSFYVKKIEEIKKLHSPFAIKKSATRISETEERTPEPPDEHQGTFRFEDQLSDLAARLSKAKMNISDDAYEFVPETVKEEPVHSAPPFVSETLAQIYESQGKLTEAVQMYEALIQRFPSKKDEYLRIIQHLRGKILSS